MDKDDTQARYTAWCKGQGCKPMTNGLGGCEWLPVVAIENFQRHFLRRDDALAVIQEGKFNRVDNAFGAKVHLQPVGFIRRTLCRPAVWWMHGVAVVAIVDGFEGGLRVSEGCRKPWVVVAIVVDRVVEPHGCKVGFFGRRCREFGGQLSDGRSHSDTFAISPDLQALAFTIVGAIPVPDDGQVMATICDIFQCEIVPLGWGERCDFNRVVGAWV